MKDILVSIIVPIYNVEKYIERCVNSLLTQDHRNIEIILVDDGSPDNSAYIIDKFTTVDDRVRVIHKKNGGVSSARNAGLEIATGEYIMFVDGDDYVDSNYVSYFLSLVLKYDCDIAMNYNNYTYKCSKDKNEDKSMVIDSLKAIEQIYTNKIFVAVWNKIYKKSLLDENNIIFDTAYWYGEGMLFNILCLQYVDKVAVGNKMVYNQVFNLDSAMRKFNFDSNICGKRSLERQKELWKKTNSKVEAAWEHHYRSFSYSILCGLIETNQTEKYKEEYLTCIKDLKSNIHIPFKADIGLKNKLIFGVISICPILMAKRSARKGLKISAKVKNNQIT